MRILGLFGPPNVEKLKASANVEGLIKALAYKGKGDDQIKQDAFEALVEIGETALLIELFSNPDEELRATAAAILARIGSTAVPPLAETLGDANWEVRRSAVTALGGIKDSRAVNALVTSLRDNHARVRESAADSLRNNASSDVGVLVDALDGADDQTRERLITILGEVGDERLVMPLIGAFKDGSSNVRNAAGRSLIQLGAISTEPLLSSLTDSDEEVRRHSATTLGDIKDVRAVGPLVAALGDDDWSVRRCAAEALGKIGDAQAVEPLINVLSDDPDEDVRSAAATALGLLRDERAVTPLIESLNSESWTLRRAVIEALENTGSVAVNSLVASLTDMDDSVREVASEILGDIGDIVVNPLITALSHEDPDERKTAAIELGEVRDVQAVEPLIIALGDDDESVRAASATALGQIADERAAEPLIALLNDSSDAVREQAVDSLVMLGPPAVPVLLGALESSDAATRQATVFALGRIGDSRALRPLFALLSSEERLVRLSSARAIGAFGGRVYNSLISALEGENEGTREAASVALGEVGDERAVKPLLDALRSSKERETQFAVARALGHIGGAGIETLIGELRNVFWDVRLAAVTALGETGDERAVKPIQAALNDQERAVRTAAEKSLAQLTANHSEG